MSNQSVLTHAEQWLCYTWMQTGKSHKPGIQISLDGMLPEPQTAAWVCHPSQLRKMVKAPGVELQYSRLKTKYPQFYVAMWCSSLLNSTWSPALFLFFVITILPQDNGSH